MHLNISVRVPRTCHTPLNRLPLVRRHIFQDITGMGNDEAHLVTVLLVFAIGLRPRRNVLLQERAIVFADGAIFLNINARFRLVEQHKVWVLGL